MKTNQHIKRRSKLWELYSNGNSPFNNNNGSDVQGKLDYDSSSFDSCSSIQSNPNKCKSDGSSTITMTRRFTMPSRLKSNKCNKNSTLVLNHHHQRCHRTRSNTLMARFDEILYKQLIQDDSQHHYKIVGHSSNKSKYCKNEDEQFYDYQENEQTQLLDSELLQSWSRSLPGGAEKFTCAMISIFLILFLSAVQLCIHLENLFDVEGPSLLCQILAPMPPNRHETSMPLETTTTTALATTTPEGEIDEESYPNPSRAKAQISFECHFKLLLIAWLCSMLAAGGIILVHFVYWNNRYYQPQQTLYIRQQQQQQCYREQTSPSPTPLPATDQFRQEIVIETFDDRRRPSLDIISSDQYL